MRAILVLAIVPMLIGLAASLVAREARHASLVAGAASAVFVFIATRIADADFAIGWLATLLVLPLPVAFTIATVAFCSGRSPRPRGKRGARATP